MCFCCFFFQAEDGIRDDLVTGVQTCALPICLASGPSSATWALAMAAPEGSSKVPPTERDDPGSFAEALAIESRGPPEVCPTSRAGSAKTSTAVSTQKKRAFTKVLGRMDYLGSKSLKRRLSNQSEDG